MRKFYLIILFCALVISGYTQTRVAIADGDWNSPATWQGGNVPDAATEDADISGFNVTVTANVTVRSIFLNNNITNNTQATSLTVNNGVVLTVSIATNNRGLQFGNIGGDFSAAPISFLNEGTVNVTSDLVLNTAAGLTISGDIDFVNNGTITCNDLRINGITYTQLGTNGAVNFTNNGSLNIGATLSINATASAVNRTFGEVTLTNTNTIAVTTTFAVNGAGGTAGTKDFGTVTIDNSGTLTTSGNTSFNSSANAAAINNFGDLFINNSGTFGVTGTISVNNLGVGTALKTYGNVEINNSGTLSSTSTFNINNGFNTNKTLGITTINNSGAITCASSALNVATVAAGASSGSLILNLSGSGSFATTGVVTAFLPNERANLEINISETAMFSVGTAFTLSNATSDLNAVSASINILGGTFQTGTTFTVNRTGAGGDGFSEIFINGGSLITGGALTLSNTNTADAPFNRISMASGSAMLNALTLSRVAATGDGFNAFELSGGSFTVTNALTFNNSGTGGVGYNQLNANGGTLNLASASINRTGASGDAYNDINISGATINITGALAVTNSTTADMGYNRITLNSGSLSAGSAVFTRSGATGMLGNEIIQNDGDFNVTGLLDFLTSGASDGDNTFTKNGGTNTFGSLTLRTTATGGESNNLLTLNAGATTTAGLTLQLSGAATAATDPRNQILIGSDLAPATLTASTLTFSSTSLAAIINRINLQNGTLDINGNIIEGTAGGVLENEILVDDENSFDMLSKDISLTGAFAPGVNLALNDGAADADYTFTYDGAATQTFRGDANTRYRNIDIANTFSPTGVTADAAITNSMLTGRITVKTGGILTMTANVFDETATFNERNGQLTVENDGILFHNIPGTNDHFPGGNSLEGDLIADMQNGSILKYSNTGNKTLFATTPASISELLLETTGTSIYSISGVDNVSLIIGQIEVGSAATYNVPTNQSPTLSATRGNKTIKANSGATIRFTGTTNNIAANAFFDLDINSTVTYTNGAGNIIRPTTNGTTLMPYGNLTVNGTNAATIKTLPASTSIAVRGNLFIAQGVLALSNGALLTLTSNATQTAFISEITSGAANPITYTGTGAIVSQRFVSLGTEDFRDFTTPIAPSITSTINLGNWVSDGFEMFFTDEYGYASSYAYTESTMDTQLDGTGFVEAQNGNDQIYLLNGANVVRNGWRVFSGDHDASPLQLTMSDTGRVFAGDVVFDVSYTSSGVAANDGWNFIGNPYACAIDWDEVYETNDGDGILGAANPGFIDDNASEGISPFVYVFANSTTQNEENGTYIIYDAQNNLDITDQYEEGDNQGATLNQAGRVGNSLIPSHQGFWVKAESGVNATFNMTIREPHKLTSAGNYYKNKKSGNDKLVNIVLSSSDNTSNLVFYAANNATVGYDRGTDMHRFGNKPRISDIKYGSLGDVNLLMNAMPSNATSIAFPITFVRSANATSTQYTLSFNNLDQFVEKYTCAKLIDKLTNTVTDLKATNTYNFISETPYSGDRFEVVFSRSLVNNDELTTGNAKCAGEENGFVRVKFEGINPVAVNYTLFKNDEPFTTFNGEFTQIKKSLSAGEYKMIDNNNQSTCPSTIAQFTITEPAAVLADFNFPTKVVAAKAFNFVNASNNADKFTWNFGDGSTARTQEPSHTYAVQGLYKVTLIAENTVLGCSNEKTSFVAAETPNDILNLDKNDKLTFTTTGGQLKIINIAAEKSNIRVLLVDGKVIYEGVLAADGIVPIEAKQQIIIIEATKADGTRVSKQLFY